MIAKISSKKGSSLLISLAILTAITLAAIVAMQRSSLQIRMVSDLQHQHEMNNAALGTLNSIYTKMEKDINLQNSILIEAEQRYRKALENQKPSDSEFDLLDTFKDIKTPDFSAKSIGSIDVHARKLPSPEGSHYYIKAVEGCGSGCSVTHMAITADALGKNAMTESIQELGVRRITPGGAGQ